MKKKQTEMEYTTTDLHEAAALSLFIKPIRLETRGNKFQFIFIKEQAEEIAARYWTGELTGSIRQYVDCLRSTKDWLFSKKRELEGR